MKPFFKASDFEGTGNDIAFSASASEIADHANAILKERGRVVYGCKYPDKKGWAFDEQILSITTHQALLVCIEEIKRECEHFGINDIKAGTGKRGYHCFHCGNNLKTPKWELAE